MKIEKRNGGYRVQPMRNGKRYSLTFDFKPTKADIEIALADAMQRDNQDNNKELTFKVAAQKYNESKQNVLSASTYREYCNSIKRFSDWFLDLKVKEITQNDINRQINEFALNRSPKTVRNYHGYISAVLGVFKPELNISTHLPQKAKNEPYIPSDDDIKIILNECKGTMYEIAIKLMCYGLRRSEVCAITSDDVEDDVLHIRKAMVLDSNNNWIIQNRNKSSAGTRDIFIPKDIADKIKENGYAYKGHPNSITEYLYDVEKKYNIPNFSAHKLRHYFASKMHELGISDADIMNMGGWETDNIMKQVYRHSTIKDKKKKDISNKLQTELFS